MTDYYVPNYNYVTDIVNIWNNPNIPTKVLNMEFYKIIRTNRYILNLVVANNNVKKAGTCYDYNRVDSSGNNSLWPSSEPKNSDMKNQDVYLFFNNENDVYLCFTKREMMYLKEVENYETIRNNKDYLDVKLTLVEYNIDGNPQNPYNLSTCRDTIDKTHLDCDNIWELKSDDYNRRGKLEKYFGSSIPKYVPIVENNDLFEEAYYLSVDDIFSILFILQTNSKEEIEKCLNNRAGIRYSCLYKINAGEPDKNHHKNIQVLRFILNLDVYEQLNSKYFNDDVVYRDLRILKEGKELDSLNVEEKGRLINLFGILNDRLSTMIIRNMVIPGKTKRVKVKRFDQLILEFIMKEFQSVCSIPVNDINSLIRENEKLKEDLNSRNIELRSVTSQKSDCSKIEKDYNKLKERFQEKTTELEKLKIEVSKVKTELETKYKSELSNCRVNIERYEDEYKDLEKKAKDIFEDREKLLDEFEDLEDKYDVLEDKYKKLENQYKQVENKYSSLQKLNITLATQLKELKK
jgi:hypothetical protein